MITFFRGEPHSLCTNANESISLMSQVNWPGGFSLSQEGSARVTYCFHHSICIGVHGDIEPLHGELWYPSWYQLMHKEGVGTVHSLPHSIHDVQTAVEVTVLVAERGTSNGPHKPGTWKGER